MRSVVDRNVVMQRIAVQCGHAAFLHKMATIRIAY